MERLLNPSALALDLFAPAPLLPLIRDDYNLSMGIVSFVMVSGFLIFTVFLIPSGIIAAKLGTKKSIALSGLLPASDVLSVATSNFVSLLPLRVAFGISGSMLIPATATVIVQWFRPSEHPIMNALNLAAQGTGVATAMFLSVPIANAFEWRTVLMVSGLFCSAGHIGLARFETPIPIRRSPPYKHHL